MEPESQSVRNEGSFWVEGGSLNTVENEGSLPFESLGASAPGAPSTSGETVSVAASKHSRTEAHETQWALLGELEAEDVEYTFNECDTDEEEPMTSTTDTQALQWDQAIALWADSGAKHIFEEFLPYLGAYKAVNYILVPCAANVDLDGLDALSETVRSGTPDATNTLRENEVFDLHLGVARYYHDRALMRINFPNHYRGTEKIAKNPISVGVGQHSPLFFELGLELCHLLPSHLWPHPEARSHLVTARIHRLNQIVKSNVVSLHSHSRFLSAALATADLTSNEHSHEFENFLRGLTWYEKLFFTAQSRQALFQEATRPGDGLLQKLLASW